MLPVKRFHWDTPEYADAFATFLKYTGRGFMCARSFEGSFPTIPVNRARSIGVLGLGTSRVLCWNTSNMCMR